MSVTINASTSSGLVQTADTSGTVEIQSNGSTKLTVSSTGAYGQLVSGTAQASTSGTAIDFTGIPSWVKRITVMFNGVSLSGTSEYLIQLGSGSITTSGYTSGALASQSSSSSSASFTNTSGLLASGGLANAAYIVNGAVDILNVTGNTWISRSVLVNTTGVRGSLATGSIALSGTLDRIRITTVNGTDTFDAGTINILYEG